MGRGPWYLGLVELVLGPPDEALKLSDEALRRARQLRQPFALGATLASSAQSFRDFIELARKMGPRSWELFGTLGLARLLRDTDRREEARAMLAEVYNWFTEGFETADLKDAKALLDELSA